MIAQEMETPYRRSLGHGRCQGHGGERDRGQRLARALGWFSVGLGVAEIVTPRAVARAIGLGSATVPVGLRALLPPPVRQAIDSDHSSTVRLFGLRELGTGLGILSQDRPAGWMWTRVAGDLLDLAFLGVAARAGAAPGRLATAALAVAGVTALDVVCGHRLSARQRTPSLNVEADGSLRVHHNVAINRSPQDCYAWWRRLEQLPRVMPHIQRVDVTGDRTSHWVATGPGGWSVEWDAEITEDVPGQLIAWRSLAGSALQHDGHVRFASVPNGDGTLVRAAMRYRAPRALGAVLGRLLGLAPDHQLHADLRRFKQVMEAGEIITTEGQPRGPSRPSRRRADGRRLGSSSQELA